MVAFGTFGVQGGPLVVNGFLFDAKNAQYPQVLAKQYSEDATDDSARQIAHRFADEIILRLGGGIPGIAETKIYYVTMAGGNKEIWEMDYDGANQHADHPPRHHLDLAARLARQLPPRLRLARPRGFQITMYSLLLGRSSTSPAAGGTNLSPAWSPDGNEIAYSSSRTGDPEIWISDANGNSGRRITSFRGPDVSPTYNPKTGAQIAWISGRTGLPQLYIMNTDGSGVQRMTDGGYATRPRGRPTASSSPSPGTASTAPALPADRTSTSWTSPPSAGSSSPTTAAAATSPPGRRTAATSSTPTPPTAAPTTRRSGPCSPTAPSSAPLTGHGADMPNWSWK